MPGPTSSHDRVRRRFTIAVVLAALVGAVAVVRFDDGPPTDDQIASRQLAEGYLPFLGRTSFAGTTDLRDLVRPSDEVRTAFASAQTVYRVASVDRDRATLVVWQRMQLGAQPFERTRPATGHGCVTVTRDGDALRTDVVDCPGPVGPMPPADPPSWGRDSGAVAAVAPLTGPRPSPDPVYVAVHGPDGRSVLAAPTADAVFAALRTADLDPAVLTLEPEPDRGDGHARGRLTVSATLPDAIDPARRATARGCVTFDLDLADPELFPVTTPAPCG